MPLSNGRPHMALPGPSMMPDRVLQAMHRPAPDIYDGDLHDMVASLVPDLRRVARTDGHVAMYICNGHGAWEASLSNTVAPGETVLVPTTGAFGHGWAEMARGLGAEVEIVEHGRTTPIDPERVRAALVADKGHSIKAVLAVHVDTSSSVRSDIVALRKVLDEVGHPALLMADCIASLGCDVFEMDAWGVDVMITGSQKGLMVPPGMAFVFFNDRAAEVRRAMPRVSRYWDWAARAAPEMFYQYFGGTAPTHHLYGLRAALDMIHEEGMENVWARHARLARAIWAAGEAWATEGPFRLNVADPAHRSHAVTAAALGAPDGDRLRAWCRDEAGLVLGIGLGVGDPQDPTNSGYFRFGHMGHVNAHGILGLIGTVEAGLTAFDIPHGAGAMDAAVKALTAD
ncbi:pyridoxal-phosphate-dependent aminotransferase family protein [Antarctobacter heliothermus]|uniref:Alanine-glyoxylate transaminase / serine-glyoxylate transaminase / serine-pyruvate transaminase n=1 Tax=Antarctobacter heliothermus TaxID=74033 RepID=A0A239K123_9RHOB|nr:aminotransferase class V-fold PLP-dependent enzyme [Antarctobacter heliothermus]SNT12016.1 alanine-glyoxylate transaminase / serine-glyoxylate transaminase / serine-pyruvate transaminase [Antarctobacter heliothermus]